MRSYWKLAALAAAFYGLQPQVDSRALLESTSSLAERDVSSASKCKESAGSYRMLYIAKKLLTYYVLQLHSFAHTSCLRSGIETPATQRNEQSFLVESQ